MRDQHEFANNCEAMREAFACELGCGHQVGAELVMGKQPIWSTWWGMVSGRAGSKRARSERAARQISAPLNPT